MVCSRQNLTFFMTGCDEHRLSRKSSGPAGSRIPFVISITPAGFGVRSTEKRNAVTYLSAGFRIPRGEGHSAQM